MTVYVSTHQSTRYVRLNTDICFAAQHIRSFHSAFRVRQKYMPEDQSLYT